MNFIFYLLSFYGDKYYYLIITVHKRKVSENRVLTLATHCGFFSPLVRWRFLLVRDQNSNSFSETADRIRSDRQKANSQISEFLITHCSILIEGRQYYKKYFAIVFAFSTCKRTLKNLVHIGVSRVWDNIHRNVLNPQTVTVNNGSVTLSESEREFEHFLWCLPPIGKLHWIYQELLNC